MAENEATAEEPGPLVTTGEDSSPPSEEEQFDALMNASAEFFKEANETMFLISRTLNESSTHALLTLPPSVDLTTTQSWYQPYPVTLAFLLVLHVVFAWHWNRRSRMKDQAVTYHLIARKKRFHRAVVAAVSHPSVESRTSTTDETSRIRSPAVAFGAPDVVGGSQHESAGVGWRRLQQQWIQRARDLSQPFVTGNLSGLPLLVYNSHLIWAFRALEPFYGFKYVALLLTMATLAYGLELRLLQYLLKVTNSPRLSILAEHHPFYNDVARVRRRLFLHRKLVTPTGLVTGLLVLWRNRFPLVAVPILPLLPSVLVSWLDPPLTYFVTLGLLLTLSWRLHPLTSVLFGHMAAWIVLLFGENETNWMWWTLPWLGILLCLSLRLPCVDHVAWDEDGNIRIPGVELDEAILRQERQDEIDEDDGLEENSIADDEDGAGGDIEMNTTARAQADTDDDEDEFIPLTRSTGPLTRRTARR